jgi:hypothetical protein
MKPGLDVPRSGISSDQLDASDRLLRRVWQQAISLQPTQLVQRESEYSRRLVNLPQRHFLLRGEFLARFKLRRGLHHFAVQLAQLHGHGPNLVFTVVNSRRSLRRSAMVRRTPKAVVSRNISSLNLSASASAHKHGEQNAGPILLHLNRRVETRPARPPPAPIRQSAPRISLLMSSRLVSSTATRSVSQSKGDA